MNNKPKLLYVDDEPINLKVFERMFEDLYEVSTVFSGMEGLDLLESSEGIQIVISDMNMPGLTGLEFIRQAKEKYPDLPYYILTGYDITAEIKAALEEELLKGYFQKPFNLDEIHNSISEELSE